MAVTAVENPIADAKPSIRDRIAEAARHATQISHEARQLKAVAVDAVEDGLGAARQVLGSVQRRVEHAAECRTDVITRLKRQSWKGVGAALAVGVAAGVAVLWLARREQSGT